MSNLHVNTTQNVNLFFTTASVGERMLAYFIDIIIKTVYIILIYIILLKLFGIEPDDVNYYAYVIIIYMLLLLPVIFYTLVSEALMNGQTPGKKIAKIKVVKIDGYQAGFFDYLVRWIFRIIDVQAGYVPGLLSMIVSKHTQRIGDLAAGTAVISLKSKYNISHTILMEVGNEYVPYFSKNQILVFSDNDMRIIKENAQKATINKDVRLMDKLCLKIETVMKVTNPFETKKEFVQKVLQDYNFYTGE